jgi:mannose-6-phosphate isomerase-like protein (cupin superfamily)
MEDGTARTKLDAASEERFVPLRRQLGVSSFGINQMVLAPGQRSRIHRHQDQEEVYLVLEGRLTLLVEGDQTELELGEGELVRVAPSTRRQLVNRGPGRLLMVALGGTGEHQSRDAEAFNSWEEQTGGSPRDVPWPPDLDPSELRS